MKKIELDSVIFNCIRWETNFGVSYGKVYSVKWKGGEVRIYEGDVYLYTYPVHCRPSKIGSINLLKLYFRNTKN